MADPAVADKIGVEELQVHEKKLQEALKTIQEGLDTHGEVEINIAIRLLQDSFDKGNDSLFGPLKTAYAQLYRGDLAKTLAGVSVERLVSTKEIVDTTEGQAILNETHAAVTKVLKLTQETVAKAKEMAAAPKAPAPAPVPTATGAIKLPYLPLGDMEHPTLTREQRIATWPP